MFSSALKSISSPASLISAGYTVSPSPTSTAGPWRIHDAKKKSTGRVCSVFIFDRKTGLDPHPTPSSSSSSSGFGGGSRGSGSSAAASRRSADEVVDRLRREAQSLARLRHPSVLELVEPVEDTRGGGLQFATEPVTASLAGLLAEKDDAERSGGAAGRGRGRGGVTDEATRRRRELDLDELEIQKGLLQISKALEFLHENAGLVHGNLTPDAILVNAKGDWKISGLSFCSPPADSTKTTSFQPINLGEVLNSDPRLPRTVQLNLDYTSPDFVLDNNLTSAADMFSLGLLAVALYTSPHKSPLEAHGSASSYKRLFTASSTVPSVSNGFLSSRPLPRELTQHVLPRLITRRPADRMTAREFQNSEYFNNIFVSTISFLDGFPAKTANEKAQFMRGLNKVLPSFPRSVMEKKLLPALLEEIKDRELLALILQNVFKIIDLLPAGAEAFGDKVRPVLRETLIANPKQGPAGQEKDPTRDAGLMVVLEHLPLISKNCPGKEFKDDMLPVILASLDSSTPAVVDASLRCLPTVLPILDFSTIKNELFPVVAAVFSKTNSLAIKVRGLNAFIFLCGGSADETDDDLNGLGASAKKSTAASALDKYTMQEKIVPLIKVIKTKEPAVMMAALNVLRIIGRVADAEFVAMEILPILWNMSLGPLLNLSQFQAFMELIRILSRRVEDEQIKKLHELSGTGNGSAVSPHEDFLGFGGVMGTEFDHQNGVNEADFERLVRGKATAADSGSSPVGGSLASWDETPATSSTVSSRQKSSTPVPVFSWSTPSPTAAVSKAAASQLSGAGQQPSFRTVTPDLGRFEPMTPSSTQFSQPLQPTPTPTQSTLSGSVMHPPSVASPVNWSSTASSSWSTNLTPSNSSGGASAHQPPPPPAGHGNTSGIPTSSQVRPMLVQQQSSSFSLAPPSGGGGGIRTASGFSLPPPPGGAQSSNMWSSGGTGNPRPQQYQQQQQQQSRPGMGMGTGMGMGMGMGGMSMSMGTGMSMSMGVMGSSNMGMSSSSSSGNGMGMAMSMGPPREPPPQKSGLDKYESLL